MSCLSNWSVGSQSVIYLAGQLEVKGVGLFSWSWKSKGLVYLAGQLEVKGVGLFSWSVGSQRGWSI